MGDEAEKVGPLVIVRAHVVPMESLRLAVAVQSTTERVLEKVTAELPGGDPVVPVIPSSERYVGATVLVCRDAKVDYPLSRFGTFVLTLIDYDTRSDVEPSLVSLILPAILREKSAYAATL